MLEAACGDPFVTGGVDHTKSGSGGGATTPTTSAGDCDAPARAAHAARIIVLVWGGLRPDSMTAVDTPNLYHLALMGSRFTRHHATYPTFTMTNAASLATGARPGTTGFYGATVWAPGASGLDSAGHPLDFGQPVAADDDAVLRALDAHRDHHLLPVRTLFEAAHQAGLRTATLGRSGPAFLLDRAALGLVLDETTAAPLSFAGDLQAAGFALPKLSPFGYPPGQLVLGSNNGDPTGAKPTKTMLDGVTTDPTDSSGTPYLRGAAYLMDVFLEYILPDTDPALSVIWLRDPDGTQRLYGAGTPNARTALEAQDALLGSLLDTLDALGMGDSTDIVVVSDHGHRDVSGPTSFFPLRATSVGGVAQPDPMGDSVSGDVRLADLLARAGFAAFDGAGCAYVPVLSGIGGDDSMVYPTAFDPDGSVCGAAGARYNTPSYRVPGSLPAGAVVVESGGGSDSLHVPDHDPEIVRALVAFLQSREEVGAIFVASAYGPLAGTLPLAAVGLEGPAAPDVVVSWDVDEAAQIRGMAGAGFESMLGHRGTSGGASSMEIGAVLVAAGPDFRSAFVDDLPSGNEDVAPTIARLLGLALPDADGRALDEALVDGIDPARYQVGSEVVSSSRATGLVMKLPTDPAGAHVDPVLTTYHVELRTSTVTGCGATHTYFDSARAVRE